MPKELRLYGIDDFKNGVLDGFKLATLRLASDKYALAAGERITIVLLDNPGSPNEQRVEITAVALGTEVHPLDAISPSVLLLDGFWDQEAVVDPTTGLARFYPEPITPVTRLSVVPFVSETIFNRLSPEQQRLLLEGSLETRLRQPELREVFFYSLAWWHVWYGQNARVWADYARANGLITEPEYDGLCLLEIDEEGESRPLLDVEGILPWALENLDADDADQRQMAQILVRLTLPW